MRRLTYNNEVDSIKYRPWFEKIPENKSEINWLYLYPFFILKIVLVVVILADIPNITITFMMLLPFVIFKFNFKSFYLSKHV